MHRRPHGPPRRPAGHGNGLARALSKLGFCSRSQARELIAAGRVQVNGLVRCNPEWRVDLQRDRLQVDAQPVQRRTTVYLMLNKPRGLVTSAADEQGRDTVFQCFAGKELPFVAPVGRLDKASEGLLLFTNDTAWAAHIAAPESQLDKTYHVQVDCVVDEDLTRRIQAGATVEGEFLAAKSVRVLRQGTRNSWLEIVLDEGKNRHIRRLLAALDISVLRLVRVAIGPLPLGNLAKGEFRHLTAQEVLGLTPKGQS
jgi:23S rRNA pseudouridine2605 synthase